MPRAKGKKGRVKNQIVEEKKKAFQTLLDMFRYQRVEYETYLNTLCMETCEKIQKMYDDKLKALPESVRNMTLSEYMEAQRKAELQESRQPVLQILTSEAAKSKLVSEKKKTLKKNKTEKKRSLSVSDCSSRKIVPSSISRVLSESCLITPSSKRSTVPSYVITPKFNPNLPISKICMRKPRAGEVVLSVGGSPLQNFADDVAISLGAGNIIKIADDTEISKLNNEFMKKLDEHTKSNLENVKKQLEMILKS